MARQLGRPTGLGGLAVARRLNRNNADMVSTAVERCALPPGAHVADIGFGGGVSLAVLLSVVGPQGRVFGVDISTTMVTRASLRFRKPVRAGTLCLRQGSVTDLPLPDGALDAVLTVNTIYFVPDLERVAAELTRVLRPGGTAVVAISDPVQMATLPVTESGFLLRPVAEVSATLASAGLTPLPERSVTRGQPAYHCLVSSKLP